MAVTIMTPSEFENAKSNGDMFIKDNDGFFLDDVDYVDVVTQPFSDDRGTLKYPYHAIYRRV